MFIPTSDAEKEAMLKVIGVKKVEDLFNDVPKAFRFPKINLPPALTEMEAMQQMQEFSEANETTRDLACFLGAGAYNHYSPAAVDFLLHRGEFYTAYTPYQPEISQGTLQAIFEFQSLIANLTGMDVANASHYDGATAAAEACIMAYSNYRGKRAKFVLSPSIHPQYRDVMRTYMCGYENVEFFGDEPKNNPMAGPDSLAKLVDENTALVMVQYPDFFGRLFDYTELAKKVHEAGALLAISVNPTALAIFKTPGDMGADIVVGEGQPLGIPLSYGGPYLGFFATKKEYVRKIAGRLVGESVDAENRRGYVLTLTAREQHIRREKATSNICTNQGLMALAATIYMSVLGKTGMQEVANLCYQKTHYAAEELNAIKGFKVIGSQPFFQEFVLKCPASVEDINNHLLDHGILGGYDLGKDYPTLKDHMLIACTEMNTREDINALCEALMEVNND
jgi:glycine dehydrogenase subunit 1